MNLDEHLESFLHNGPGSAQGAPEGGAAGNAAAAKPGPTPDHMHASAPGAGAGAPDPAAAPPMSGPRPIGPFMPSYESYQPPAQQIPVKPLIGVGAALIALVIFGIGWNMMRGPEKPKARVQTQSIWSEQQQLAREAMQMAREAQQMQREHMEEMRRAMEGEYTGYYESTEEDW